MTVDRELGAVAVGTGIGSVLHVPALRDAGVEVHALVGRNPDKTARRAALLGIDHACTSLTEALALPGVDVVAVATPPHSHAPLVLEAIAAGRHVLCEKPFARDVTEARRMLAAAEDAGIVHVLGTEFRYDTANALLGRVVGDGAIGTPRFVLELLHVSSLADVHAEAPPWFDDAAQGGGWFDGSATHIVDRVRSTLGEFRTVTGSIQRLGPRPGVTADDTYTITFALESGVEGLIHSTAAVAGPPLLATKVTGTRGTAWIDMATRRLWVDDDAGAREVPVPSDLVSPPAVPPPADLITTTYDQWHSTGKEVIPYACLYRAMRARIQRSDAVSDPPLPTFADGVALQVVMDTIRRSSDERRTLTVDPT